MKILVTGSAGFIGQNMVNALQEEHDVITYDIRTHDEHPEIKDLDWIIHLGAISSTTETDVEKVFYFNYDYSMFLLEQSIQHNVNFQWASSASVYGNTAKTFCENDSVNPQSPYAWSKYLFERFTRTLNTNIRIQGFRYFNVYGPHEDHKGKQASPFYQFQKQYEETGQIKLFEGSKNYCRDFVSVEKVIEIQKQFFNVNESGIWNIGTGKTQSFTDVAKQFTDKLEYIEMPENIRKHYQEYTCADMTKTETTLAKYK